MQLLIIVCSNFFCPALPFDDHYLQSVAPPTFDPRFQTASPMEVLLKLASVFGPGIHPSEFRRILHKCILCSNLCFVDRTHLHRCRGPVVLTQADGFDFVQAMSSGEEHAGLSLFDLHRLFARCGDCDCICMEGSVEFLHGCGSSNYGSSPLM